jgi:cytochrome c
VVLTLILTTACDRTPPPPADEAAAPTPDTTAPALTDDLDTRLSQASAQRGQRLFQECSTCHGVTPARGHGLGPNLAGVFGRRVGSAPGFDYSDALREAGFFWTPAELDRWLADPRSTLQGTRMNFRPLRDPGERADLIKWLQVATDTEEDGQEGGAGAGTVTSGGEPYAQFATRCLGITPQCGQRRPLLAGAPGLLAASGGCTRRLAAVPSPGCRAPPFKATSDPASGSRPMPDARSSPPDSLVSVAHRDLGLVLEQRLAHQIRQGS